MHSPLPTVSVVVPVYNEAARILDLLECLCNQSYPRELVEILLIDDGSTDSTKAIVNSNYPGLPVITLQNAGSYAARNAGIASGQGEVIAFTDGDCLPHADWIRNGIETLVREKADIVAGAINMCAYEKSSAIQMYDKLFGINQRFFAIHLNFGATANLFVTRKIASQVGGFDSRVRSGGDVKFCRMALMCGGTLSYADTSIVNHPVRKSLRAHLKKTVRIYTGLAQVHAPWSFLRFRLLSHYHHEQFDYDEFMNTGSSFFRMKFRSVYYFIHTVSLFVYTLASLKRSYRRIS